MEKKVSVIIPVYNVEVYLTECLHSVVNQTFQDIEIILVDDGSTDRSPEIMKAFAEKDDRIKIITQPNRGVSTARNVGVRQAKGEYILFVDSDDMIMPNSVESLYNKAHKTGSDLLLGSALWYIPNSPLFVGFKRNKKLNSQIGIQGEECYIKLMKINNAFPPLVYLFFIKRELVIRNNLFFKKGIIHEDELWCIQAMLKAARVTMIDFNYYYYRQREGSLMNSDNVEFRIKSLSIVAKEINKLAQQFKKENKSTELTNCLYSKIFILLHVISTLLLKTKSYKQPPLDRRFFYRILLEMYSELPYAKQRECLLRYYYFINTIINNKKELTLSCL